MEKHFDAPLALFGQLQQLLEAKLQLLLALSPQEVAVRDIYRLALALSALGNSIIKLYSVLPRGED